MDRTAFPYVMNGGVPFMSVYQNYTIMELNWHPTSEMTVTSTTGHFYMNGKALVNATHTAYAGPALGSENQYRKRDTTEELRLNTDFAGPVNGTAGAFYQGGKFNYHPYRFGNILYGLPAFQVETIDTVYLETYSLYGQLRWKIMPNLELAGGLRWTDETRRQDPYNVNLVTHVPVYLPLAVNRIHSSTVVPEFTITYRPTDDLTFFGAYKHAYKSGSYSVTTLPAAGQDNSFGDEKVKGGEIGMKSRLMDRQVSFNLAGYYYHFAGLQSGAISPAANGLPVIRTINAGSARTYGIDMDATYVPPSIPGLDLKAALGWSHARYITLNNVPCWGNQTIALGCDQFLNPATGLYTAQDLSGTPLIRAPDWQINIGFDYEFALSPKYNMTFSSSNSYTSKYKTALSKGRPAGDNYQGAAFKADLTFAVSSADDLWELALIGKNIGDKLTAAVCSQSTFSNGAVLGGTITGGPNPGIAGISETSCASDPGREIWLRLTVKPLNALRD
jgi:iron complex outermembrane receptor protein